MKIETTIEHNGITYPSELAVIKRTTLGREDHGMNWFVLHCEWPGAGQGVGCLGLDFSSGEPDYNRIGSAWGMDVLIRVMETVGVENWESVAGKRIHLLQSPIDRYGSVLGIAGVMNGKVLVFSEHAQAWKDAHDGKLT